MTWMTVGSLVTLAAYIGVMVWRYGRQEVISEYAYKGGAWAFSTCIGLAAALLMPPMIERAPEDFQFLGFLAPTALMFVAAAPHYKGEDSKVHRWAAILAAAFAVLWGLAVKPYVPIVLALTSGLLYLTDKKGRWFDAEVLGLAVPYTILLN